MKCTTKPVKRGWETTRQIYIFSKRLLRKTETAAKSFRDLTYGCRNILFTILVRFTDVFLTRFVFVAKQRAAFVGHLDTSQPAKGRTAVAAENICARCTCYFKMADVEDDEKFLYGGKLFLKFLGVMLSSKMSSLLSDVLFSSAYIS